MLLQVFSLPLKNPVLIFSLILFIILLTPVLLQRLRIPDLIGLIIAGAVIGPNGVGIMERDSSIELFGTVGLLYIMFIAGLEIDMADLKKNYGKTLTFYFSDSHDRRHFDRCILARFFLADFDFVGQYVCFPHAYYLPYCQ